VNNTPFEVVNNMHFEVVINTHFEVVNNIHYEVLNNIHYEVVNNTHCKVHQCTVFFSLLLLLTPSSELCSLTISIYILRWSVKLSLTSMKYVRNKITFFLLCFSFLSKSLWDIILSFILYGCETWYLIWREELSKKVFEKRVLKNIFGHKRDEVTGGGGDCIMRSFMICTAHQILFGWSNQEECDGQFVLRMKERGGTYWILVGKPEGKRSLGRPRRWWECNIKMVLKRLRWTSLMCLRIGRSCG